MTKNLLIILKIISVVSVVNQVFVPADMVFAGTITGKVEVVGDYGIKPRGNLEERIKAERAIIVSKDRGVMNAVISIRPVNGIPLSRDKTVPPTRIINQRQKTFYPHVLPIPVGTTITFKNSDPFVHRVISNSEVKSLRMEFAYEGATIDVTFDRPGIVDTWCDDHKRMQGWILVMETPFFAVTDEKGFFTIPEVPPGRYRIEVWHEVLGTQSQEVTVGDGDVRADFGLPGKEF